MSTAAASCTCLALAVISGRKRALEASATMRTACRRNVAFCRSRLPAMAWSTRPSSAGSASTFHHCLASTATPWPCGTWVQVLGVRSGRSGAGTDMQPASARLVSSAPGRSTACRESPRPALGTATEVIRLTTSPPTCRRSMKATVRLWSEHGELVRKRSPHACGSGNAAPVFHCAFNAFPGQNTGCFSRRIAHCDASPARRTTRVNFPAAGSQSLRSRRWLSVHRDRADRSTGLERLLATHGRIRPDKRKTPPSGSVLLESGAGNETRTRDLNLGKVALYQLSYSRLGGGILPDSHQRSSMDREDPMPSMKRHFITDERMKNALLRERSS
ncbi:hypothetical protein SMG44B_40254 [Stenotrophomonas maltophilia]